MSYRITYTEDQLIHTRITRKNRIPLCFALLVLVAGAAARLVWPEETTQIMNALFPWTQPQVKDAIHELALNLSQGDSWKKSITAFCQEMIKNGSY